MADRFAIANISSTIWEYAPRSAEKLSCSGGAIFQIKTLSWSLDWHQDRVIAVKKRQVVEGFDNWTKKADIWHCEPPQNILENMFFTQLYLDDVSQSDGPVQFLEGSHLNGKLSQEQINAFPKEHSKICTAKRGDVFGAHGLLVHRSDQSISKKERRILRVDFCNVELPKPLEWAFR